MLLDVAIWPFYYFFGSMAVVLGIGIVLTVVAVKLIKKAKKKTERDKETIDEEKKK